MRETGRRLWQRSAGGMRRTMAGARPSLRTSRSLVREWSQPVLAMMQAALRLTLRPARLMATTFYGLLFPSLKILAWLTVVIISALSLLYIAAALFPGMLSQ